MVRKALKVKSYVINLELNPLPDLARESKERGIKGRVVDLGGCSHLRLTNPRLRSQLHLSLGLLNRSLKFSRKLEPIFNKIFQPVANLLQFSW